MKKQGTSNDTNRKMHIRFQNETSIEGSGALASSIRPLKRKRRPSRPHLEKIGGMDKQVRDFISSYVQLDHKRLQLVRTSNSEILQSDTQSVSIVNLKRLNDVRDLNHFLYHTNQQLESDGIFIGCVETKYFRKKRILKKYPFGVNYSLVFADYVFKRVLPKLPVSREIYRTISRDRDKAMSKTEALGRIFAAGFQVIDHKVIGGLLYIVARKVKAPLFDHEKRYGLIFRMRRQGKNGKPIHVFKLRTMHSYSEFIQQYVYEQNNLAEGGKLKNDFRVSPWGRIVRKYWLDELPMLLNLLTGELKLVGVRPLSAHYLSLYSDELKQLRLQHKPGLIPPFYADMPKTIEEIQDSEMRYLQAHAKQPFLTDVQYLAKAFWNIVVRRARSK